MINRGLKLFYREYVIKYLKFQFPDVVSYNRFVELMPTVISRLTDYLVSKFGKTTGISYVDSTSIQVCKPKGWVETKC
jgi:hypothetical protein